MADAIACRKGVTLTSTVPYEKMNGNFFAQLNKEPFWYSVWSGKAEKKHKKTLSFNGQRPRQASLQRRPKRIYWDWYASTICIENLDNQIKCYWDEEAVTQIFTKDSFEQLMHISLGAFDDWLVSIQRISVFSYQVWLTELKLYLCLEVTEQNIKLRVHCYRSPHFLLHSPSSLCQLLLCLKGNFVALKKLWCR